MIVENTKLENVLLIRMDVFEDHRGEYIETYNEKLYRDNGIAARFVQDDMSVSHRNVLKGIHGDATTWKLISYLYGKFYLVVINYDKESKDYGKWESFVLSDRNKQQLLVPPKYGNGHLCLSSKSIFHYKQSSYYDPSKQFTIKWNDPKFRIWWPVGRPILSLRDESGHLEID